MEINLAQNDRIGNLKFFFSKLFFFFFAENFFTTGDERIDSFTMSTFSRLIASTFFDVLGGRIFFNAARNIGAENRDTGRTSQGSSTGDAVAEAGSRKSILQTPGFPTFR